MPRLRELDVQFARFDLDTAEDEWIDPIPHLLDHLDTPSLKILQINDEHFPADPRLWPRSSFEGFIARSGIASTLRVLSLMSNFITGDDVIHAAGLLPNLEYLSLSTFNMHPGCHIVATKALLRYLRPGPSSQHILPKLRQLAVSLPPDSYGVGTRGDLMERLDALANLVDSRTGRVGAGAKLTMLQLWIEKDSTYHSDDLAILNALRRIENHRAHGLKLDIVYVVAPPHYPFSQTITDFFNDRLPEDTMPSAPEYDAFHDWIVEEDLSMYLT
jgi:hypothetical protein